MKRRILSGLITLAVLVVTAKAQENFSQGLRPEEFAAAGLGKLSPAELAQLDALFQKYGVRPKAIAPVAQTPAPTRAMEPDAAARIAQAEARAQKAEQEAAAARAAAVTAKAEQKKAEEGFLTKAKKVFVSSGTKVEVAALETEIDGAFDGWDATTTWRMKDGTMWRVDNKPQPYDTKRVTNPKVKIYPATMNGYWLEFVDLDLKLRVRQIRMN